MLDNFLVPESIINIAWILVALFGIYIVFIHYRANKKPPFLKVIWSLIAIDIIPLTIWTFLSIYYLDEYFRDHYQRGKSEPMLV